MKKITKSFSIDSILYEKFKTICKQKDLEEYSIVQDIIKQFVKENYYIDANKIYRIKNDDDGEGLRVHGVENGQIILSNGDKIDLFNFDKIYEPLDIEVYDVLQSLKKNEIETKQDEIVDSSILNEPCIDLKKIISILNNETLF